MKGNKYQEGMHAYIMPLFNKLFRRKKENIPQNFGDELDWVV